MVSDCEQHLISIASASHFYVQLIAIKFQISVNSANSLNDKAVLI